MSKSSIPICGPLYLCISHFPLPCPVLYSCWHSFQITYQFLWREKDRARKYKGILGAFGSLKGRWTAWVCVGFFCWSGSSVAPSYLTLHVEVSLSHYTPLWWWKDTLSMYFKMPPNSILFYWIFKITLFLKNQNRFGSPCKLDVLEGIWVPIEKEKWLHPFLYISLLKVPGDLAKMTIAEL